jgi:hypothetical protein
MGPEDETARLASPRFTRRRPEGRRVASRYQIIQQDVVKRVPSGPISAALLLRVWS